MDPRQVAFVGGILLLVAILIGAGLVATFGLPVHLFFTPTETAAETGAAADDVAYEVVAKELDVPWEVVILEQGRYLVTERTGALLLIEDGERHELARFDELYEPFLGEGGLLGVAVHPEFDERGYLYVYLTVDHPDIENTVRRFEADLEARSLTNETMIIEGVPSHRMHNGGRIAFGPDGYLYVTTGDASEADLAQDRESLAGTILRLADDGSIPEDNPFGTEVYSYGHRNPQGITWDDEGRLWSTEHGPTGRDELNLIDPGANYGWPVITGDETHPNMETPVLQSGRHETWAPSGATFADGSVFFAGLRGERLYEAQVEGDQVHSFVVHFFSDFGRLRAVSVDPTGEYLYFTTSNTDGRGDPETDDDRLIRISVDAFR